MKEEQDPFNNVLIDWSHVVTGMYLVRKNAQRIFADAKFLYDNKKFQSAIPLFIISVEESFKSHELSIKFRKKQPITQTDWSNLQSHKHKLSYILDFVIENLESMNEETAQEIARESGHEEIYKHRSEILDYNRSEKSITLQFQFLKERCLYQNWNKEFSEWDEFDYMTSDQKEDLTYFIMKRSEIQLQQLDLGIELAVNVTRRDDFMIKNLEFPKYNEFRKPKDFEIHSRPNPIKDYFKYSRGLKILESLIIKKTFGVIDQVLTNDLIRKCLKITPDDNLDDWYPHPMIKSIHLAIAGLHEGKKDGNYAGYSDDADQTHEGKPMMYCVSVISKKDEIIKIEKIMINGNEYSINDKVIEQVLKTELIIETQTGKDVSLEKTHQAYSKIGLKLRTLRDNEIQPAIDSALLMIKEGKIEGITEKMKDEIKLVTRQNWDDQDPLVRSMIGTSYAPKIIQDENTFVNDWEI